MSQAVSTSNAGLWGSTQTAAKLSRCMRLRSMEILLRGFGSLCPILFGVIAQAPVHWENLEAYNLMQKHSSQLDILSPGIWHFQLPWRIMLNINTVLGHPHDKNLRTTDSNFCKLPYKECKRKYSSCMIIVNPPGIPVKLTICSCIGKLPASAKAAKVTRCACQAFSSSPA